MVAFEITTPPIVIGSSLATGVIAPVRPIWMSMPMRRVVPRSAGNLCAIRSEEHTSELQSLMRISYAVFCLKKKKTTHHNKPEINKKQNTKTLHNNTYTHHTTQNEK